MVFPREIVIETSDVSKYCVTGTRWWKAEHFVLAVRYARETKKLVMLIGTNNDRVIREVQEEHPNCVMVYCVLHNDSPEHVVSVNFVS